MSDVVKVFLKPAYPLALEYSVANVGYLRFLVVPANI